jgi:hypothetical protein
MTDQQAVDYVKTYYCGQDVDFKFANSGLSYSDASNQIKVYKIAAEPSISNADLRQIVDVMLMSIHWQGYQVDSENIIKSICSQHEDGPNAEKVIKSMKGKQSHPVGQAHRRVMELFEQNESVTHIKFLQDQAARGLGGPHTVCNGESASASSEQ